MFGLDMLYLGVMLFSSITLYPFETPLPSALESVTPIGLHREWWRDDGEGKCTFEGVAVPYVRDWAEVVQQGDREIVVPAEPDKRAAYAILVNRKLCQGKAPEAILRAGALIGARRGLFDNEKKAIGASNFAAGDLLQTPADKQPKWLAQVVGRIERVAAAGDAKAKAFLEASVSELDAALPARATGRRKEMVLPTAGAAPASVTTPEVAGAATSAETAASTAAK